MGPRKMIDGIVSDDIIRLGPDVLEELRTIFMFEQGVCWLPATEHDTFPDIEISPRQRERAEEAIGNGEPFWDLVGSSVFLPFPGKAGEGGKMRGALVLHGVPRTVGPEEPERWLGLISSWVWNRLETLKKGQLFVEAGIPGYLGKLLSVRNGYPPCHVLSLRFRHGMTPSLCEKVVELADSLLGSLVGTRQRMEFCGGSAKEIWFVLNIPLDKEMADRALAGLYRFDPLKRLGLNGALLYSLPEAYAPSVAKAEEVISEVSSLVLISDILGMPVFSSFSLIELESRFHCHGLAGLLPHVAKRLPRSFAVAFASVRESRHVNPQEISCSDLLVSEHGSTVLVLKRVPFKAQDDFDIVEWARQVQERLADKGTGNDADTMSLMPVGACASYQPTVGRGGAIGAAFWAYVHAFMLEKGDVILFDHITWQVRGDELLSSGAVSEACRAYRNALRLQDENVEILNSLGVALVQAGRRREAEACFKRASRLDPDDFISFYNLCGIQHTLCKYEEAEAACLRAVELRQEDTSALTRLGHLLLDSGRFEDALRYLKKACSADRPLVPALHRLLGICEYQLGRWKEAKASLEKCLKMHPGDVAALAWLALGYAEHEGDPATAVRLSARLPEKSSQSDINAVLSRLRAIIAESSLDKEKAGG